jgi:hypothetical protein
MRRFTLSLLLLLLLTGMATYAQNNKDQFKSEIWNSFKSNVIAADKSTDESSKQANLAAARWHALNYEGLTEEEDDLDFRSMSIASFLGHSNARLVVKGAALTLERIISPSARSIDTALDTATAFWRRSDEVVVVDRRSFVDTNPPSGFVKPGPKFTVTFSAVEGFPGHAFIVIENIDPNTKKVSTTAFGFYPDAPLSTSKVQYASNWFKGVVLEEIMSKDTFLRSVKLKILPDSGDFSAAMNVIDKWQKKPPPYQFFLNNCIDFIEELGNAMRLPMPSRALNPTPQQYVSAMINKLVPPSDPETTLTTTPVTPNPPAVTNQPPANVKASEKEKPNDRPKTETMRVDSNGKVNEKPNNEKPNNDTKKETIP